MIFSAKIMHNNGHASSLLLAVTKGTILRYRQERSTAIIDLNLIGKATIFGSIG